MNLFLRTNIMSNTKKTMLVKMKNGSREKNKDNISRIYASENANVTKEIETTDGTTLAIEIENESMLAPFKQSDDVLIEESQTFRIAEQPTSLTNNMWNWLRFFFSRKTKLNNQSINNFALPNKDLEKYKLGFDPTDFKINPKLWNILDCRAPEAWKYGFDGSGIVVAVLDTGILPHSNIVGNILPDGINTCGPGNPTRDVTAIVDHGLHVSGTIAANNRTNSIQSIYGVAPKATILPIKVLGTEYGSIEDIIEGLVYARKMKVDVVNMSLGGDGPYSQIFHEEVKALVSAGIVVICAGGNSGNFSLSYPAKFPEVISVGSCNQNNKISYFSNHSPELSLCSPGENIYSLKGLNEYSYKSGTSMSAPLISGSAALLKQINPQKMTPKIIKSALLDGAVELIGVSPEQQGNGKLDVVNAIILANKILEQMEPPPHDEEKPVEPCREKFDIGCRGDHILKCQISLHKQNLYTDTLDGIYGNNTANAVLTFTQQKQRYIDPEIYQKLTNETWPDIFQRCLQLTASFEGTGYSILVKNFDGAILTYGIIGFTLLYGELEKLLLQIYEKHPNIIKDAFKELSESMILQIENYKKTKNISQFQEWGLQIQRNKKIFAAWKLGFAQLATFEECRSIQRELAKEVYWQRALNLMEKLNLKQIDLNFGLCFDCAVQGFNNNALKLSQKLISQGNMLIGQPWIEKEKRKIIATANAQTCNQRWKDDVWSRKSLFITGEDSGIVFERLAAAETKFGIKEVHGRKYFLPNWGFNVDL